MKQSIYKAIIGLVIMICVADAASAQTIFRGMRSKKTKTNFKAPAIYSIERADTSLSFDTYKEMARRDSILLTKKLKKVTDSLSLTASFSNSQRIDSLMASMNKAGNKLAGDTVRDQTLISVDTMSKSVDAKLTSIQNELQTIKTVLRNQSLLPRYRYMQYQLDSLNMLAGRLNSKPTLQSSERLQVRIYRLQQDSIRHELQKLIWISQYPAKESDSSLLNAGFTGTYPGAYHPRPDNAYVLTDLSVYTAGDTTASQVIDTAFVNVPGEDTVLAIKDTLRAAQYKQDSVVNAANTAYSSKLKKLERRLDSMERVAARNNIANKKVLTDTASTTKREVFENSQPGILQPRNPSDSLGKITDTSFVTTANPVINRATQNTVDSLAVRLQLNSDSLVTVQARLKAARDSGAYYRRTIYAMDLDPADTVVEKRKWYSRIIPKARKQKEEEQDVAKLKSYSTQETYFAEQAKSMSNDIERLQRDNQNLKNDYERLRRNRDDRYTRQAPAAIIQAGTNISDQRELNALRREISEMRLQMTGANMAAGNRDTVIMQMPLPGVPAVTATRGGDSAQIVSLQSDLALLRKQLDSIRLLPPPSAPALVKVAPAAPTVAPAPVYDVSSFPVISVYFGMNAATLPATQTGKISPMVSVAQRNESAKIVLAGFTDPVGNVTANKALAKKRISFVRNLLVTRYKIPEDKIVIEEPEISTAPGLKKANPLDRRVDLRFE